MSVSGMKRFSRNVKSQLLRIENSMNKLKELDRYGKLTPRELDNQIKLIERNMDDFKWAVKNYEGVRSLTAYEAKNMGLPVNMDEAKKMVLRGEV